MYTHTESNVLYNRHEFKFLRYEHNIYFGTCSFLKDLEEAQRIARSSTGVV